jgi:hypothetical protein
VFEEVAIDAAGLLDGKEEFLGDTLEVLFGNGKRLLQAGNVERSEKRLICAQKVSMSWGRRICRCVGDVEGEEIGAFQKAVDGLRWT